MPWYIEVVLWVLLTVFLIINGFGLAIAISIFHPRRVSLLDSMLLEYNQDESLIKEYETWNINEYKITSRYGYDLQVYYVEPITKSNKFVVILHGYSYTHLGALKYAKLMRDLGYHVVMYDERFHGASGGNNCTLGYYEKDDLYDVISNTFSRYEDIKTLGTYGESMGAATCLLEQSMDNRVAFVVSDCSFSNLEELIVYLIKAKANLPKWPFLNLAKMYFKIFTKANINKISPFIAVEVAKCPILFFHGEEDKFIPSTHSEELYRCCNSFKILYIGKNQAKHIQAYIKNKEEYQKTLSQFLENIGS